MRSTAKEKLSVMVDSHQPHQAAFCSEIDAFNYVDDMTGKFSAAAELSWSLELGVKNMSTVMLTGTRIL